MKAARTGTGVGHVYLVGAGPGDPGLITVRGRQCLEMADTVLYDGLANPQLLQWAPQANCISVGKHGQTPIWTQAAINARLLELARQGQRVVRLKGGDPAVFARTAEELDVLAAANIPFEVVPGITAALAAASYVGIPITHRSHASAVAFVTGHQQADAPPQAIDWEALARFPGTLVFYMGVTTVEQWTNQLMAAGKDPQTPAAIVRRCSWSDQSVIRCQLSQVVQQFNQVTKMRPPVIVIVGAVAALGTNFDWFTQRPLHGCGVLITRASDQLSAWAEPLRQAGAEVYTQSVIEILPPSDWSSVDAAIDALRHGRADGITFSSANGVTGFFDRLRSRQFDSRLLAGITIAAVGPSTAEQLAPHGLRADVIPASSQTFSALGLLDALPPSLAGQRWIVTSTNRSADTLARGVQQRGAEVLPALCYETQRVEQLAPHIASALESGRIQIATISSGFVAEASAELLSPYRAHVQPVSISAAVSQRLTELGWPAVAQSDENSLDGIRDAIQQWWQTVVDS